MRIFSYGGGVQSNGVLVLQAQGKVDYDAFLFANVGEDSENPATLEYFYNYAIPYAERNNIQLIELRKPGKTLLKYMQEAKQSFPIPVRMSNGFPTKRACTVDYKIEVINRWMKENGANEAYPPTVGLGISTDEIHRTRTKPPKNDSMNFKILEYPLIDLRISRDKCIGIVVREGLPEPPESSCYFCPFHSMSKWYYQKEQEPELFEKSVNVEKMINRKRRDADKDNVYLTRFGKPLDIVVGGQIIMFDDEMENCESGYCMV